jgi:hypothetical protein
MSFMVTLFAALPATTNYLLNSYGFGTGGAANATTSTYALEGTTGEVSGQTAATATYNLKPSFIHTEQAHVPKLSALNNNSGMYYNKLHFVIDAQNNPSDALYALSISTDNFASDTRYIKSDLTIGSSLAVADYKNLAGFGGAGGSDIIGLTPNTTYYVQLKATQGKFTESGYGPVSSATTANPHLTFTLATSAIAFGSLLPNTVTSGNQTADISFSTNAASGGDIYISSQNGGLRSPSKNYLIPAVNGDLSSLSHGFGAQVSNITTSSGSFSAVSPYDTSSNTVGLTDSTIRRIMTASAPVTVTSASVSYKARATSDDVAASDYTELSTVLAAANF